MISKDRKSQVSRYLFQFMQQVHRQVRGDRYLDGEYIPFTLSSRQPHQLELQLFSYAAERCTSWLQLLEITRYLALHQPCGNAEDYSYLQYLMETYYGFKRSDRSDESTGQHRDPDLSFGVQLPSHCAKELHSNPA